MRVLLLLSLLVAGVHQVHAQEIQNKYRIGAGFGIIRTVAKCGPQQQAQQSGFTFTKPLDPAYRLYVDRKLFPHIMVGIEIGMDGADHGYEATQIYPTHGYASGDLTAGTDIFLYKAGVRLSYRYDLLKRFTVQATLTPTAGYYFRYAFYDDTAAINAYSHDNRAPGTGYVQYLHYPVDQRQGLNFLLRGSLLLSYRIGKYLGVSVAGAYQQGFHNYYIDYVNIRQYNPITKEKVQDEVYYTKINGTGWQLHFGMTYDFGK